MPVSGVTAVRVTGVGVTAMNEQLIGMNVSRAMLSAMRSTMCAVRPGTMRSAAVVPVEPAVAVRVRSAAVAMPDAPAEVS